jgi:hypothetical protein
MTDNVMQATLATWAAKDLPARLDVMATAKLLGFAEHDIQILMAVDKLTPLGDPAPNAPSGSRRPMIRLAADSPVIVARGPASNRVTTQDTGSDAVISALRWQLMHFCS